MTITKEQNLNKIEIMPNGVINIRDIIEVKENGVLLASSYHRRVIAPGDDVSSETSQIKTIAGATHTPEVISKYLASIGG